MALRDLGRPFGGPHNIFNIPAPIGSERAGQMQSQMLQGMTNMVMSKLMQDYQARQTQQDLAGLLGYGEQMQQFQQQEQFAGPLQEPAQAGLNWASGMNAPFQKMQEPQMPIMQSQQMQDLQGELALKNLYPGSQYGVEPGFFQHLTPEQRQAASLYLGGQTGRPQGEGYGESAEDQMPSDEQLMTPNQRIAKNKELFGNAMKGKPKVGKESLYGETAHKQGKERFIKLMAGRKVDRETAAEMFDSLWDEQVHEERSGFMWGGLENNNFMPRGQFGAGTGDPLGLGL